MLGIPCGAPVGWCSKKIFIAREDDNALQTLPLVPIFLTMKISRRPSTTLLVLCLLVLQIQVWASADLNCRHEADVNGKSTAVCRQHHPSRAIPEPAYPKSFDCHKCALHCLVTIAVPMGSPPMIVQRCGSHTLAAGSERHFYQFVPGIPERPPRA
ncbi:hypothetical protein CCR95_09400 [Thiocystis minor]|nr:hypothetical protein [Thiocystis minor]